MKNKVRYLGFLAIFILLLSSCSTGQETETADSTEKSVQILEVDLDNIEQEVESEVPIIYPENDTINHYLIKYNELNSDDTISSEMFHIYHHHGRDHSDQIKFDDKDGFEITISERVKKIDIVIKGYHNRKSNDEFLEQVKRFLLPLLSNSDTKVEEYWQEALENQANTTIFSEFEINLNRSVSTGTVEYLKIYSK